MSSDGRYMYHHPPGMSSSYDYSYPQSYEPAPISQPPPRQMRSTSSQSQSPNQPSFNGPQSPYQPNYAPPPYGMQQQAAPWSNDNWNHYNQSYPPPAPIPEVGFNSGPGRPEAPPIPPESRGYAPNEPPPDMRRDERQPGPSAILPQAKVRRRENQSPVTPALPGTPPGLDFIKLLDSYRIIMDASQAFSNGAAPQGRPPPAETVERMLQSATYGVQMLESAVLPVSPPQAQLPVEKDIEDKKDHLNDDSSSKRQKGEDAPVQEGQTCLGCNATSTPEWRRGPMGPRTLCNACGLVYAKLIKKRVREGGRAYRSGGSGQGGAGTQGLDDDGLPSSVEGGSDDEDSYGSQDRRSEGRA